MAPDPSHELAITLGGRPCQIAVIESTHLGLEDHGIFSLNLSFRGPGGGWGQGIGHFSVGDTTPLVSFLSDIHAIAGVDRWEKLPGRTVLVIRERSNYDGIIGLAKLDGSQVLIFKDWFDAHS